ncbi:MAG: flagellar biosynthesis anti-sigma factor FlgM [Planctomycetes bacterium]|nr:flagellar biosynthesis anti-sigma factor FlgM [Planctomycetota bacterium]
MPDISSIGNGSIDPLSRPGAVTAYHRNGTSDNRATVNRASDRVELSDHVRFIGLLGQLPEGREDLVEQIRQAIVTGEYETEYKLNIAISRLIDDINE